MRNFIIPLLSCNKEAAILLSYVVSTFPDISSANSSTSSIVCSPLGFSNLSDAFIASTSSSFAPSPTAPSISASSFGRGLFISVGNTKLQNSREKIRYVDTASSYMSSPLPSPPAPEVFAPGFFLDFDFFSRLRSALRAFSYAKNWWSLIGTSITRKSISLSYLGINCSCALRKYDVSPNIRR